MALACMQVFSCLPRVQSAGATVVSFVGTLTHETISSGGIKIEAIVSDHGVHRVVGRIDCFNGSGQIIIHTIHGVVGVGEWRDSFFISLSTSILLSDAIRT